MSRTLDFAYFISEYIFDDGTKEIGNFLKTTVRLAVNLASLIVVANPRFDFIITRPHG